MAQLVVRNIENSVKTQLRRRAKRNRRSMEEEVREILLGVVREEDLPPGRLGTEIAALFAKAGLASEIPELHGQKIADSECR